MTFEQVWTRNRQEIEDRNAEAFALRRQLAVCEEATQEVHAQLQKVQDELRVASNEAEQRVAKAEERAEAELEKSEAINTARAQAEARADAALWWVKNDAVEAYKKEELSCLIEKARKDAEKSTELTNYATT